MHSGCCPLNRSGLIAWNFHQMSEPPVPPLFRSRHGSAPSADNPKIGCSNPLPDAKERASSGPVLMAGPSAAPSSTIPRIPTARSIRPRLPG